MIKYIIQPITNEHIYHVTLEFTPTEVAYTLKLPVWIPGSYMVREFSKNIYSVSVNNGNIEQIAKNEWSLTKLELNQPVIISYEVYAFEVGIRTAYLDTERGYFNPTSTCLYIVGYENIEHQVTLINLPKNWDVVTGLTKKELNTYVANNYDELIDCPFELGTITTYEFVVNGAKHYFALSGTVISNFDSKRFIEDITKICKTEIDMFGGVPPFKDYTFILYLGGEIFTGLEHRNSTLLMAPYYSLPVINKKEISSDYLKLLGLISHEFFHTWNVKRIKPQVFNPYKINEENYTKLLWWFEGITSYYDDLILFKSGLIDEKKYLSLVVENINTVYKYNATNKQSLTNSSLTSWIKYYRQDENSVNRVVSYYVKGSLVGLCLDLIIRKQSNNTKSLDDVILGMYQRWLNDRQGILEDEVPALIKQYTNLDLTTEINQFINDVGELPIKDLLADFGIDYSFKAKNYTDNGALITDISEVSNKAKLDLGCKLIKDSLGYKVTQVYNDSLAEKIGLGANDVIIAINHLKLTDFERQFSLFNSGDMIVLTFFRQERLMSIETRLEPSLTKVSYLTISNKDQLKNWLS